MYFVNKISRLNWFDLNRRVGPLAHTEKNKTIIYIFGTLQQLLYRISFETQMEKYLLRCGPGEPIRHNIINNRTIGHGHHKKVLSLFFPTQYIFSVFGMFSLAFSAVFMNNTLSSVS